jgi:hypothetical protein
MRSKFPKFPAEQQPMTRPWRCGGVLVILMRIQASTEPIMNVRRIFTGMNHLQHHHIKVKCQKLVAEMPEDE